MQVSCCGEMEASSKVTKREVTISTFGKSAEKKKKL